MTFLFYSTLVKVDTLTNQRESYINKWSISHVVKIIGQVLVPYIRLQTFNKTCYIHNLKTILNISTQTLIMFIVKRCHYSMQYKGLIVQCGKNCMNWVIKIIELLNCSQNIVERRDTLYRRVPFTPSLEKIKIKNLSMFQNVSLCILKSIWSITVEYSSFHFDQCWSEVLTWDSRRSQPMHEWHVASTWNMV